MTAPCSPIVVPYSDVTDKWISRCNCGWMEEHQTEGDAQAAASQHRQEGQP